MAEKTINTGLKVKEGVVWTCINGLPNIEIKGMSEQEQCEILSWSPAHMLLSAVESCFYLTLRSIAEKMRIKIKNYSSSSTGNIFSEDGKHKEISEIIIKPDVELENEADRTKLKMLYEKAHEYCFIARSVKGKIVISG